MKTLLLVACGIGLLLGMFPSATAQEATETADECRAAAQAWYDDIDADGKLPLAYQTVLSNSTRASSKTLGVLNVSLVSTQVESAVYPECIALARDWYLMALDDLVLALTGVVDSDVTTYFRYMPMVQKWLGQFRGYLVAKGVQVDITGELDIAFK